jgi:molecular chaperone DnaK
VSGQGWALAIDFGTSFTTGAATVDGGAPAVVEVENSRYFPSTVVVDSDGQVITGRAAIAQATVYPERAVRAPKRALVAGASVVLPNGPVAVTDLVAAVLRRVYDEAVLRVGGQPPSRVVLTHPARWQSTEVGRFREAAAKAGMASPELMPEPVAAAWRFAGPSGSGPLAGGLIGVFDLGGGTLDTALLEPVGGGFAIAGPPGGDAELGGEDLDELLMSRLAELASGRDEAAWNSVFAGDDIRSRRDLMLLRSDVTTAKEALSAILTYEVAVPGYDEGFRLTRREFTALIGATIDTAVARMLETIALAGRQPADLSALYLSGGSSRIPMVAERLSAVLGIQPKLHDDPKAVVALGALMAVRPAVGIEPVSIPAKPRTRDLRRVWAAIAGATAVAGRRALSVARAALVATWPWVSRIYGTCSRGVRAFFGLAGRQVRRPLSAMRKDGTAKPKKPRRWSARGVTTRARRPRARLGAGPDGNQGSGHDHDELSAGSRRRRLPGRLSRE